MCHIVLCLEILAKRSSSFSDYLLFSMESYCDIQNVNKRKEISLVIVYILADILHIVSLLH